MGRAIKPSAASALAGNGCSTMVTLAAAQAERFAARLSAVQPSLASTISSVLGAAIRTAAIRSGSPAPPSLILSSLRPDAARAAAPIASGVPIEIVYAVVHGC